MDRTRKTTDMAFVALAAEHLDQLAAGGRVVVSVAGGDLIIVLHPRAGREPDRTDMALDIDWDGRS